MKRGFHLVDGMLACGIILVSIQGSLLLSQKSKQAECLVREKSTAWDIMRQMRQYPDTLLLTKHSFDFTYTGEITQDQSYFHVEVEEEPSSEITCYHMTLFYRSSLGEDQQLHFKRWDVRND